MASAAVNFVKVIEEYPCLYNNKLPEYSRKDVTDKAWLEVAQRTNTSVYDCQNKWKNIRNGFVRSLKPTPCGSSTKQKKLYYLYEELQFLLPFVKAIIYTNDSDNIPQKEVSDESSSSGEDVPPCTLERPSSRSGKSNSFNKKSKIRKVAYDTDRVIIDYIKRKESKLVSARKMFLLSLLPDVEKLSAEQMRKFRIKTLLLLEEIQSEQS
ncbi:uncharacterized protein LOC118263989 [Spodoptera frugiperda]|uniref:Uncharacterized protein LOC118263989 n=1 Tax=Spodoptera frugiperda TaxID=7108 RepID=A0A9R0EGB0_SPOFR|nr:uncharacterized protein LOC118263989 [Spodoptera frugiperda]